MRLVDKNKEQHVLVVKWVHWRERELSLFSPFSFLPSFARLSFTQELPSIGPNWVGRCRLIFSASGVAGFRGGGKIEKSITKVSLPCFYVSLIFFRETEQHLFGAAKFSAGSCSLIEATVAAFVLSVRLYSPSWHERWGQEEKRSFSAMLAVKWRKFIMKGNGKDHNSNHFRLNLLPVDKLLLLLLWQSTASTSTGNSSEHNQPASLWKR